jgi:hypothetical protein
MPSRAAQDQAQRHRRLRRACKSSKGGKKMSVWLPHSSEGEMVTGILMFLIAICGLTMVTGGVWGVLYLSSQTDVRIPLRYYGLVIGMICGGFGLWGIARSLRLLLFLLVTTPQHGPPKLMLIDGSLTITAAEVVVLLWPSFKNEHRGEAGFANRRGR